MVETAEGRLRALKIELPEPPEPLGAYVETVQAGGLLFLSGVLPIEDKKPKFTGAVGKEVSLDQGRQAARLACLKALSAARDHLGSLDRVRRVIRLVVSLVTSGDFKDHAKVADGASQVLLDIFGKEKMSTRVVAGFATLPLGTPVVIELLLEVE